MGGGFALGAKLCRPESEVWVIYGDGSLGYSVAEFDTFTRHKVLYSSFWLNAKKIVAVKDPTYRVFTSHRRSENSPLILLPRILLLTFSSLWLFFIQTEPLSKYSPVTLYLSPATRIYFLVKTLNLSSLHLFLHPGVPIYEIQSHLLAKMNSWNQLKIFNAVEVDIKLVIFFKKLILLVDNCCWFRQTI